MMNRGGWCLVACAVVSVIAAGPARAQALAPAASVPSIADSPTTVTNMVPSRSSFGSLFREAITDFGRIPAKENLLIVAIGGLAATVAHPFDSRVSRSLSSSKMLEETFEAGDTIGGAAMQMAGALATHVVGRATGNARVTAIGADLVRAQILTQTMTAGIKFAARRTRPDGMQFSFPSGHASTAFATATVLQRDLGWKFGVPAYAVATYVATSRVQVKRHYVSDVTIGAALGVMAGRTVTVGRGDARFAVAPSGVPGGAGVNFTWVGRK